MVDFGRAHSRYLVHENYVSKYANNPIVDVLRQAPYENRIKLFPAAFAMHFEQAELMQLQQQIKNTTNRTEALALQMKGQELMQQVGQVQLMGGVYALLWAQHLFPYYEDRLLFHQIQEPIYQHY